MLKITFLVLLSLLSFQSYAGSQDAISVRTDYGVTTVGTITPVVLVASLPFTMGHVSIFDSSGQTFDLVVGVGATATHLKLPPGGGDFPLHGSAGSQVSIISLTGTANSVGTENDLNIFFN